jgi:glycosyltransferase involved in cell wall biosynthesis
LPLKLHRYLRRGRFRVIYFLDHAHAVFYGILASSGTSVRVRLMPVHTTGQWDGRPSLRRPILMVRSRLDRIIAIAQEQRRYLIEEEGIPASQLVVIPNGIPLEDLSEERRCARRREVRDSLGIDPQAPVIGITAVLRPEKNHEMCLAAFSLLRREMPSARLCVVGDGPRRAFLEAERVRLGIPNGSVLFLGRRSDARWLLAGFDLSVLSSHRRVETLPLSLLEAMDCALPVVATRVGALHEMVEEGRSGLLVEPGDEAGLAAALLRLLADPALRFRMGERGKEIVRERFSVQRMVRATEDLILELLDRRV